MQSISPTGNVCIKGEVYVDNITGALDSNWIAPPDQFPQLLDRAGLPFPAGRGAGGLIMAELCAARIILRFGPISQSEPRPNHTLQTPALSEQDNIAVRAWSYDPVVQAERVGLWAADQDGKIDLITSSGRSIELAPGDIRVISDICLPRHFGGPDGIGSPIGSHGCLAFETRFADEAAALITTIVPAPNAAFVARVSGVFCARRRRA